jgi:precorrin-6x reductase
MRLLILGGTSEASALAAALARRSDLTAVLSLAGRTAAPETPPIPHRIGGFGGIAGLSDYLAAERMDAVVDATHPFAEQMSHHAAKACRARGPFDAAAEEELMRREAVEVLVTKNSGGAATHGKVEAAARLGLPLIVVQRPARPEDVPVLHDLHAVLDWIEAHRPAP